MPTLADLLRTPGTPANTVKTTLADLFRGYNREAVAGLLGAPVDMANTVSNLTRAGIGYTGHKLGMLAQPPDLIEKPALGSDWIYERLPGQPALTGSGAENTGRMLGALLSPPVAMQAAPGVARAMGRALQEKVPGMAENYLRTIGGLKDIDVWHGSPHKFDRFDSSKIGTGEGAQAYGHGMYFAENPNVAADYKWNLSRQRPDRLQYDGKPMSTDTMLGRALEDVGLLGKDAALQKIDDSIRFNEKYAPDMANMYRSVRDHVVALDPAKVSVNQGHLYRVDLPDSMLPRMLDWDVPLSGQPGMIQKVFDNAWQHSLYRKRAGRNIGDFTGADLVNAFGSDSHSRALFADDLRKAGIPGIRYLDGGSRGAGTGTRNYVVFPGEEQNLRILERNGVPIK